MMRRALTTTALSLLAAASLAVGVSPASGAEPWWRVSTESRPTNLAPGSEGEIVVTAENMGDGSIDGAKSAVTIADVLPAGLEPLAIAGTATESGGNFMTSFPCSLVTVTCTFERTLAPYKPLEVRIKVRVPESVTEPNRVSVNGGGAPAVSTSRPVRISETPVSFGMEEYELRAEEEGGKPDTQAGSHPYQVTGVVNFNQGPDTNSPPNTPAHIKPNVQPIGLAKDVTSDQPAGLIGNPTPFPTCSLGQFLTKNKIAFNLADECAPNTAVGVAVVRIEDSGLIGYSTFVVPIFNLEPYYGEPARFGFAIVIAHVYVTIDASVRSGPGGDYGITVGSSNITQTAGLLGVQLTFWGVPGDPRHNNERGWACLGESDYQFTEELTCQKGEEEHPPALLTMPTSCSGPLQTSAHADSWAEPKVVSDALPVEPLQSLTGCNRLPFAPAISAEATTDRASAPSGLDFNIDFDDEGLTSTAGLAQSQLNKTVVTLPSGFTINPSAGVGLGGCRPGDYAKETVDSLPGEGCPNDSKLGTVEVKTPLLSTPIHGSLYIAQPYENQFSEPGHPNGSLVALYVVLKNPATGILIKLAGQVIPNPATGQLVTVFENTPQLAFSHFNFHFREGQQAPLISPPACGTYTTEAQLSPWSEPIAPLTDTSQFTITKGYDGGACPSGGVPPFKPGIESGLINNNAGAFSSFYLHLTRTDGEQEISGFSTNLPAGLTGDLSGIPFCLEADIEAARHKTGAQEEASPSCPAASEVGHSLVGTGVGAVLAYVPGKIYLAGPFHGAPFSIVSVTSAVVGPFDLGTVVLRFGLTIDPTTARVSVTPTSSEPIPTIIDGIVTHVRDIRVYISRPNFILDPTSCNPMSISSTLNSPGGASTTVSSPFQSASCQTLKFAPKFVVSTSGKTSRAAGASLHVKLSYPTNALGSYANIAKVKVDLPKQLPSRLSTLQKACTDAQFETNPAGCPAESRVGQAKAITPLIPVPLEGPAYFVSHGGAKFPELIIVLQGYGVTIDLHGETFISKAGITSSTFDAVPDQPIGSFELTLPEGKYSALAANGNLCQQNLVMPTAFTAQNGAQLKQNTPIEVEGCPNTLSFTSHSIKGRTLTVSVHVPGAGKLTVAGKGLKSVTKTANRPETITLKLTQKRAGRLKTTVNAAFTPSAGKDRRKQAKSLRLQFKK
jgi:hypothetical protein